MRVRIVKTVSVASDIYGSCSLAALLATPRNPQVLKCTRSLQLHNTQVLRFSGIDICLLCPNAAQYNSAIENGKYDFTGVTVREFITGVEFQMQLNLGLHFDCFIWAVTILRSQRYSQDITLIGSSIISTIFSFEHIKFRDKHSEGQNFAQNSAF